MRSLKRLSKGEGRVVAARRNKDYQVEREEAEAKFANLQRRKFISEQKYEQFVQLYTDKEGSASDMCSVASKRSSASSIARRHDMIALQWKQKELSLELERADAEFRRRRAKSKWNNHGQLFKWSC